MKITVHVPTIIDGKMEWYFVTADKEVLISTAERALGAVQIGTFWYYHRKGEVRKSTEREIACYGAGLIDERGIEPSTWEGLFSEKVRGPLPAILEALGL